jgi:GNAT superfamily N-acetyltransferase
VSGTPFRVALLDAGCDRNEFTSGSEALDDYFHGQVSQDIRRRITTCFVALSEEHGVAGYYTLASTSLPLGELPAAIAKKLPRYPSVPAVRMGRLAVDQRFRGQGLGGALLADALARAAGADIAAFAPVSY